MSTIQNISLRQSVRKFKNDQVPLEDLQKILTAAGQAPSAKNIQNWHFVVVTNQEKITELAGLVEKKNYDLAAELKNEEKKKSFTKFLRFGTFFKNAPAVIFVYAKDTYVPTGLPVLEEIGADAEDILRLKKTNPALQNIGAAVQTLSLAARELGYGTCWMTSPNYAAPEISESLNFHKEGYFLAATLPIGIPEGELRSPPRKALEDIMTHIS